MPTKIIGCASAINVCDIYCQSERELSFQKVYVSLLISRLSGAMRKNVSTKDTYVCLGLATHTSVSKNSYPKFKATLSELSTVFY